MSVQRRFLNLIVDNHVRGTQSLRCIDLNRQKLFNTAQPAQRANGSGSESEVAAGNQKKKQAAFKFGRISLPSPSFDFGAAASDLNDRRRMQCFQVAADGKVFCADQLGRGFILEADACRVMTMPRLHKPKTNPITLFVPSADLEDDEAGRGSFYIMERIPTPEAAGCRHCHAQGSDQFESFEYHKISWRYLKCWARMLLPPPPYLRDIATGLHSYPEISSYAVVGSEICISVDGVGTYCMTTTKYTWRELGKWTLPFYGKVEYAADQKLWFGISAKDRHFAAADLSAMDSRRQLMGTLGGLDVPEEWKERKDPQLVCLGSGDQNVAVLTGVLVVPHASDGDEKVKLRMIAHKSRCLKSGGNDDTITDVF